MNNILTHNQSDLQPIAQEFLGKAAIAPKNINGGRANV